MNALDFMARFEEDCLKFYEALGSNEQNPELVNLYGLLADSQRRHLGILETLKETTRGSDVESALVERAAHVVNGFREVLYTHDIAKAMKNDRDAFSHVLHAEEEMIKLCEGMAKAESNVNTKALLSWLAVSEKRHLREIEEIYDFVESPGCYLEWGEFSNLRSL